ncbi:restriction endonuclease subunit S [Persicobacter diffluens]|uniref:Restriction endonuclease subunit S n=1 Tax=Persicobacter diffluens TaxID=981 RepID=A0AAN4W4F5_9BACT|nr:restriction endonuclease subunit S [Persicobacter diffluens]
MSYIEKLLAGAKVEWKTLGDIGEIIRGNGLQKKDLREDGFPAIHYGQIFTRYGLSTENTYTFVDEHFARKLKTAIKNDLLIATTSENDEDVLKPLAWLGEQTAISGDMMMFRHRQNVKFLAYYFQSTPFQKQKQKYITGAKVRRVSSGNLAKMEVPIPPLSVQEEIVRILDTFTKLTTKLTTELTTELTMRKKQYSYYRDSLLSFEEREVKWKTLGEIGEFQRGKRFVKDDMISEGIPCIHYGEMYTHYGIWADKSKSFVSKELTDKKKLRVAEKGDIIIVGAGETIEDIGKGTAWLSDDDVVIHDACFSYRSALNPKYVAYYTRTKHFHNQIRRHISSGKISAINAKGLSKVVIPIPSSKEQERIVTILDDFDTLTTSINEGLPKEVELRKKQYEYYRDLLLNFPKD